MSNQTPQKNMRWPVMLALFGPFILFVIVVIIMYSHMENTDPEIASEVPNALQNKMMPQTTLSSLNTSAMVIPALHKGKVLLVNFWGSWCPPCREEHPVLARIAQDKRFLLIGINFKDNRDNALRFLNSFGDPFYEIGFDPQGRAAIEWGVYGPPETFIVDKKGIILHKHIGPLTDKIYKTEMLPIIEKALQ